MFAAYAVAYLAFVLLCVLNPKLVATKVGSLNLAITYGFALIVVAIILALVYNFICSRREKSDQEEEKRRGEKTTK
jgi:uncharacterized membrane protein (DUF485 family)